LKTSRLKQAKSLGSIIHRLKPKPGIMIARPNYTDAPEYYHYYFNLVTENNLETALISSSEMTSRLIYGIREDKESYSYDAGKWNIKQLLSHINDTERILAYRALRFSRMDKTALSGFDEDLFAPNANTESRNLNHLLDEYISIRRATESLFEYLTDEMLDFKGNANNLSMTARGIGFMIVGHNIHHMNILKERYL
jgi:uncharacterized damage-inducible protein DinB